MGKGGDRQQEIGSLDRCQHHEEQGQGFVASGYVAMLGKLHGLQRPVMTQDPDQTQNGQEKEQQKGNMGQGEGTVVPETGETIIAHDIRISQAGCDQKHPEEIACNQGLLLVTHEVHGIQNVLEAGLDMELEVGKIKGERDRHADGQIPPCRLDAETQHEKEDGGGEKPGAHVQLRHDGQQQERQPDLPWAVAFTQGDQYRDQAHHEGKQAILCPYFAGIEDGPGGRGEQQRGQGGTRFGKGPSEQPVQDEEARKIEQDDKQGHHAGIGGPGDGQRHEVDEEGGIIQAGGGFQADLGQGRTGQLFPGQNDGVEFILLEFDHVQEGDTDKHCHGQQRPEDGLTPGGSDVHIFSGQGCRFGFRGGLFLSGEEGQEDEKCEKMIIITECLFAKEEQAAVDQHRGPGPMEHGDPSQSDEPECDRCRKQQIEFQDDAAEGFKSGEGEDVGDPGH